MKLTSSTVRYPETVNSLRIDYIIALVPVILWSLYRFAPSSAVLITLSVASAVLFEFLLKFAIYKRPRIPDIYSIYLGAVFALTLYSNTSYYIAAVGGALSVIIYRFIASKEQCFIFAPFAARLILLLAFPQDFELHSTGTADFLYINSISSASTYDFVLGTVDKAIGSVSALAILLGALYLLLRRHTNRVAPLCYIATLFLLMFCFPLMEGRGMESALSEMFAGEMLFVFAFVMTDFTWSPRATIIKSLSGILCAALTFYLIRSGMYTDAYYLSPVVIGFLSFVLDRLYFTFKYKKYAKGES